MQRDDVMLFILTFLTSLAIGMYIYIVAFKPTYVPENLSGSEAEANEWSLVGKKRLESDQSGYVYPSFRVLADGTYVYIAGGDNDDTLSSTDGKLSRSLLRELRSYDEELGGYTMSSTNSTCRGDGAGFDYEYRLTVLGVTYALDTCRTVLSYDTEYSLLLQEVWDEIEGRKQERSYTSVADWLEDWIRQNLGTDPE